jgi:S1-C subfamily serine protease
LQPDDLDRLTDLLDPESSVVPALGILAVGISERTATLLPSLRWPVGVIVAAHAPQGGTADVALLTGDVIHSVNGIPVTTVDALRALIGAVKPHDPIVLQVERNGQLTFLAFESD